MGGIEALPPPLPRPGRGGFSGSQGDCPGPALVWCAEIMSVYVDTVSVGQNVRAPSPGKRLARPTISNPCGPRGSL